MPNYEFVNGKRKNRLKKLIYEGSCNWPDPKKPDVDNQAKAILDAMQGVLYEDDAQVVVLHSYKMVDVEPPYNGRTEFFIRHCTELDLPRPVNKAQWNQRTYMSHKKRVVGHGNEYS